MHFFPLSGNNCVNPSGTDTKHAHTPRESAHADTASYSSPITDSARCLTRRHR